MTRHNRTYSAQSFLDLQDPEKASVYLNAVLEDEVDNEEELFLLALRAVAEAQGMKKLASDAELKRESLYRMLSVQGNPRLSSLRAVLRALGLRLAVEVKTV